jgi:hypothetical protein
MLSVESRLFFLFLIFVNITKGNMIPQIMGKIIPIVSCIKYSWPSKHFREVSYFRKDSSLYYMQRNIFRQEFSTNGCTSIVVTKNVISRT